MYRKALKDFDQALQLDQSYLRAYLRKGMTLQAMGKIEDSRKVWKEALQIAGDIEIHLDIYRCLQKEGELIIEFIVNTTARTSHNNNH
jgi:tetratricopeptide (TPR) repeat protein